MPRLHVRLSEQTYKRLDALVRRHPSTKSKSELARSYIELCLGDEPTDPAAPNSQDVRRRLDDLLQRFTPLLEFGAFAQLALIEFLKKPERVEELQRRAKVLAARVSGREPKRDSAPARLPPPHDLRKPTGSARPPIASAPLSRNERLALREAHNRQLIRELEEES